MFAITSFGRFFLPNHGRFASSNASDFPKCGCKITYFLQNYQIFPKKVVPLHPNLEKFGCEDGLHLGKEQALCARFAPSLSPEKE
jgi:hypothetical protein